MTAPAGRPARSRLALAAGLLAAGLGAACRQEPPPRRATPVEERAVAWRADPGLPAGSPDELVARGWAALQADLPASTAAAAADFRAALVRAPERLDALAGLATAFADGAGEEPDGEGLRDGHALLDWGLAQAPDRPDLLAARARLLLLVPSARNQAQALELSRRAAPAGGSGAALALGLALLPGAPAAAAEALEAAARAAPADRRLLAAAARAGWAAGDAVAALRLGEERLALDPDHPAMLELAAEVEAESDRPEAAALRLRRWREREPTSPLPPFLLGRLTAQAQGDFRAAAARLEEARLLARGDVMAARIDAQRAAVALARGDEATAAAAVAAALARVPASAPAQYQAARLAFRRGDRKALHEAAGVVGGRCGPAAARRLAARQAELGSAALEDAVVAWKAWAAGSPRDPAVALEAGGALARLGLTGPALEVARGALRLDPIEPRLRRRLGDCWEGAAGLAEAAERFEAVAQAEGRKAWEARLLSALAEATLGRAGVAARLARQVARDWPQVGEARLLLAQVALDEGRPAEARREAEVAARLLKGRGAAASVRARALEALRVEGPPRPGELDGPVPTGGAAAALGRARRLARLGRIDEARAAAEALLAEDPEVVAARGLLLDLAAPRTPARR